MAGSKANSAGSRGLLSRLQEAMEKTPGEGRSARMGSSSVVSFCLPGAKVPREQAGLDEDGVQRLFMAHTSGLMPRDPVAHPKLRSRPEGAAQPIFLCEEPVSATIVEPKEPVSKAEVDISAFVEAVSAAYPQPRDPDVRAVLKARPNEAARPFVYLPGAPEETVTEEALDDQGPPVWDAEAVQRAHTERELKAFHEFLDRMESGPLEALDRPLAELDEKVEARRRVAGPLALVPALYDPILEGAAIAGGDHVAAREARPVAEEDRHVIQAVIEPLEPVAKPRFPLSPAELLPGGIPQRLSPSQRAHLKRPATLRDRHGRIAPVTYSLNPRGDV